MAAVIAAAPAATSRSVRVSTGRPFTFGQYIQAQAAGDASVLAERGRPVLTLTLRDVAAGAAAITAAIG